MSTDCLLNVFSFNSTYAVFSLTSDSVFDLVLLMFLITGPMLHFPENTAPGSIANFPAIISPDNFAVDLSVRSSFATMVAFSSPAIIALAQVTSPSIMPLSPKTNLPSC